MNIVIRPAHVEDVQAAGAICHEAFTRIASAHGFPPDFPSPEVASDVLQRLIEAPNVTAWVAEDRGRIVGSNFLSTSTMGGVGPITVDPQGQNAGVGRHLMQRCIEYAEELKLPGVRLVQAGYHTRSLSLYAKLGFVAREPLAVMQGKPPKDGSLPGHEVRLATAADIPAADAICLRVHGHTRTAELEQAVSRNAATAVLRDGRIVGYATELAFFGYAVAEDNEALQALIAAAGEFGGPGILVPVRNAALFGWCLKHGLRVVQPMTLMTTGLYNEPQGSYLPSVLF